MKNTGCPKSYFTEIIVMFQGNFTLLTSQCLGDTKCALNIVDKSLNNFYGVSLSFSPGDWL